MPTLSQFKPQHRATITPDFTIQTSKHGTVTLKVQFELIVTAGLEGKGIKDFSKLIAHFHLQTKDYFPYLRKNESF